ncbi:MAG: hypothetical protein IPL47_08190, partial [Phyllobacteriaceae bacterium]|nr:hypothetical protein [Phyllobacteriaceae bacterium]
MRDINRKTGGLGRWRRRSPATMLLAFLLTFLQMQTAFAAIVNTATAGGTYGVTSVTSTPSGESVDVEPAAAALSVTKSPTTANFSIAGDVVTFDIVIANSGTTTVNSITVTDPTADSVSCPGGLPVASLAPTASITCTASHTITPADVTAGAYTNTASASGAPLVGPPVGPVSDNATINRAVADLVTVKTLGSASATPAVGETVTYTITVTN